MATTAGTRRSATRQRTVARKRGASGDGRAEELLGAALDLFAERNFAAVTIKEIASAIGCNTALIYYYFKNKEDLFQATIEMAIDRAFEHFAELRLRHDNPADVLSDWLDNHVDLFDPIHKFVKVSLDYAGSPTRSATTDRSIRQFYDEEARVLSGCIRDGIAKGVFRSVDPDRVAAFISTYLDGVMVRSVIGNSGDLRESIALLREQLWHYLGYQPAEK